ncbi:MAG: type I 3-dehydroquinate dehydratase, partial [Bacteroidales bacterium]|nr:type I 3-dehydroquinate dehydratase [Bacteroidales bacterium]
MEGICEDRRENRGKKCVHLKDTGIDMICVSLQKKNLEELFAVLERPEVEMAEIRLDLCPLSEDDIRELFSLCDKPLVATCRIGELSGQSEREKGEEKEGLSEEGADWKQGGRER